MSHQQSIQVLQSLQPLDPPDIGKMRRKANLYRALQMDNVGQPNPSVQVKSEVYSVSPSIMPAEVFRPEYQQQVVNPLVTTSMDKKGRIRMRRGALQQALTAPAMGSVNTTGDFLAVSDRHEQPEYRQRALPQYENGLIPNQWMTYGTVVAGALLILFVLDRMA
jgi:hypothetical protein